MRLRMRMKRLSAIVLAAALTVSLLPVTAQATDTDGSVTVSVMETEEDGWAWELDGSELYIIGSDYVWLEESCIEENDDLLEIADQVETISLNGAVRCMDGTFLRCFTNLQQINMDYMYYGEEAEDGYASDLYYDDDALIFSEWWGEYDEDSGDVVSEDGGYSYILWVSPDVEYYTVSRNISDYAFANCSSLTEVWFDWDAVSIADNAFYGRELTAYYPNENEDWTADRLQDYGGSITWESYGSNPSYVDAVAAAQVISSTGTEYTATIEEEGAYAYLRFTPDTTAYYNVYTTGEEYDVYAYLYNSNWECMAEDDDSADWPNASITALLEEGTTYYVAIRHVGYSETGSCGVVVEQIEELSGDCSADNSKVSWALDTDGTLTISGIGAMPDYDSCDDTPWAYMRDYIYNIEIGANITYIGNWAFEDCSNLQNVYFDGDNTDVSDYAFGDNGVVLSWDDRVVLYGDYTSDLTAVYYDGEELTAGEYSEEEDPNDGDYDYCVYTGSNIAVIYFTYTFLDNTYYPSAGAHMFTFAFGEGEDAVEIDLGKEVSGNQYFDFDESTGTLTMSSDYWVDIWDSYDEWWDYNEDVTQIVLGENIRYIYAVRLYEDFPNLESVTVEQEEDTYGDEDYYYTQLYIGEDGALYYKEGGIDTWYDEETEQDVEEEWTSVHLIRAQTEDEVFTVTSDVNVLEDYALGAANCPNLTTVVFEGEMPDEFWDNVFYEQEVTAYYNTDYDSWTDEDNEYKFQDYGGSVTWESYTGEYDYGTDKDGSGSGSSGSDSSGSDSGESDSSGTDSSGSDSSGSDSSSSDTGSNTGSVSGSTGGSSGTAAKASQKITIKKAQLKKTIKAKKLKKKSQTFKLKAATSGDGKITFKKTKGNKKITISKTGKVTVKKGLKKGTYKVKVKITAKATAKYKKASVTKTITIKVK